MIIWFLSNFSYKYSVQKYCKLQLSLINALYLYIIYIVLHFVASIKFEILRLYIFIFEIKFVDLEKIR